MKGRAVGAHNVRPRGGAARLKEERFARPFGLSPLTIKPPLPQIPNSSFLIFPFPLLRRGGDGQLAEGQALVAGGDAAVGIHRETVGSQRGGNGFEQVAVKENAAREHDRQALFVERAALAARSGHERIEKNRARWRPG